MNDKENSNLEIPSDDAKILGKIDNIVRRNYLKHLSELPVTDLPEGLQNRTVGNSACLFPIKRIVYDREENNLQKLMNIYVGAATIEANVAIIINHPEGGKDVEIYIGVCNESSRDEAEGKVNIFLNNLTGNFPGCQIGDGEDIFLTQSKVDTLLKDCLNSKKYFSVSSVSGVASLRKDAKKENAAFFQGIEKLIDGMENRAYSAIIIANCITADTIAEMQAEYENLYHMLSPYARLSISLSKSNAESISKNLATATAETVSKTKSKTLSIGKTESESDSKGGYKGRSHSFGGNANVGGTAKFKIPFIFEGDVDLNLGGSYTYSKFRGENWNKATTVGNTNTTSDTESDTAGNTFSVTSSDGKSISVTMGQSHQLTFENKTVQMLMTTINQQIQRLHTGMEQGMFAVSAYFIAPDVQSVNSAASVYKSIITGDNSCIESSAINVWNDAKAEAVKKYLNILCHPVFWLYDRETVTPASIVTSEELAIHMELPKKSVTGIPVSSSVSFGRSIHHLSPLPANKAANIPLGKIYHLGAEGNLKVRLDLDSLTMHTLLCGTTGVGKSNSTNIILRKLPEHVKFLVIEPAKGEYKDTFHDKAAVYGTNPYRSPLLRINPFRFCQAGDGVHILEHLDRLTSIFNVCWPMEAAMPAVLKNALERAYTVAGWDLRRSINFSSPLIFPTFEDVMHEVENFIATSKYSDENKGNYIGALCTRLKDLTTGINSMIFSSDDLSDAELFDENVIVDLSRVGNSETKALIMGLLLIRLQEYRQCTVKNKNSKLQHITILEEAHHLLRNSASPQAVDGANLVGRSVEMLSNAFAEMRTYGEGFFIIDQSPEQLDKSVVRNTNTKIIMRLPEYEDRRLVGKAVGLSEEQISELAKLPTGVAIVYQNDWLESVLVKIPKQEDSPGSKFEYTLDAEKMFEYQREETLKEVLTSASASNFENWLIGLGDYSILKISKLKIPTACKREIIEYALNFAEDSEPSERKVAFMRVVYEFFHAQESFTKAVLSECKNINELKNLVLENLDPQPEYFDEQTDLFILLAIEHERRIPNCEKIVESLHKYQNNDLIDEKIF